MGANQSLPVPNGLDSETPVTRPGHNRTNSTHDLRSTESTKKMRLDDLLLYTSPVHTDSHVELASRIDRVANLPPAPITTLQRMTTTKVNHERSSLKVIPASPSMEELSDSPDVMPLIKRRSLLYATTPGLSTRVPRSEKKKKLELRAISETSEIPLLPHNENNANRDILEVLRTATPAITNLALGSFRQGTLRIVNGAPSPVATPLLPCHTFSDKPETLCPPEFPSDQKRQTTSSQSTSSEPSGEQKEMIVVQKRRLVRSSSAKLEADFKAFLDGQDPADCKTEEQKFILQRARSNKHVRAQSCASLDLDDQVETLQVVSRRADHGNNTSSGSQGRLPQSGSHQASTHVVVSDRDICGRDNPMSAQHTSMQDSGMSQSEQRRSVSQGSTNSSQDDATTFSSNLERASSSSSLESYRSAKASRPPQVPAIAPSTRLTGWSRYNDTGGPAPFQVQKAKPKKLEDMLRISSGPNANHSMPPSSPSSSRSADSSASTTSSRRGKSVPLSYVPFEPIAPGSKESKVKFYRAPHYFSQKQKADNPEFGMRMQTASTKITKVLSRGASEQASAGQRASPRGPRPMLGRSPSSNSEYFVSDGNAHEIVVDFETELSAVEPATVKKNTRHLTSESTQQ